MQKDSGSPYGGTEKSSEAAGFPPYQYPTQGSNPQQYYAPQQPLQQQYYQQYPPQAQPPPPYFSPYQQGHPMMPPQQYTSYPYPAGAQAPPQYSMPHTGTTVVVQGAFDAGARFDGVARPNIPPPPPGCPPNAAQMAALHGHTVVGTQKKDNFFWGETGGGWTW